MPEEFDFSKLEEQKRFEELPKEEKERIIEEAHEEALKREKVRKIVQRSISQIQKSLAEKSITLEDNEIGTINQTFQTFEKNPEVAGKIATTLSLIAFATRDKSVVLESNKTIQIFKENPEIVKEIADRLKRIVLTRHKEAVLLTAQLINSSENVNLHDLKRLGQLKISPYLKNLEKLKEKGNFSEKVKRMRIYKNLRDFEVEIDDPDLSGEWLEKAGKLAQEKDKEKFTIKRSLSLNESLVLLEAKVDEDEIKEISELADSKIEKSFPLDKIYERIDVPKLKEKGEPLEISKSLVSFLLTTEERAKKDIAKHSQRLRNVLRFFDKEKLRAARNLVRRKESKKIFSEIRKDFEILTKENKEESAQSIRTYFKELAKKELEGKTPKDAEALSDLIDAVESIGKARVFESLFIKMQKGDLTDLADTRLLSCCCFYPDGIRKEASLYYLKDKEIGLLWLKSATYQGEKLDNIGVAILVNTKDKKRSKVLMVDSVEGGEALAGVEVNWQEKILEAIKKVAQENNCQSIVFNSEVANARPKSFSQEKNCFLEKKGYEKTKIYLKKIEDKKTIDDWNSDYLEAFDKENYPEDYVSGYKVEVYENQ